MDIGGWLRSLGLEEYAAAFRENKVDPAVAVGQAVLLVLGGVNIHLKMHGNRSAGAGLDSKGGRVNQNQLVGLSSSRNVGECCALRASRDTCGSTRRSCALQPGPSSSVQPYWS
jgi:hypothetical protein